MKNGRCILALGLMAISSFCGLAACALTVVLVTTCGSAMAAEAVELTVVERQGQARRGERFAKIDTLRVGEFTIDLCRREDGAFGLGAIRQGDLAVRGNDVLVTWQVDGRFPRMEGRDGLTVSLRDPLATLTLAPERRQCAGTTFVGLRMQLKAERGPIVETASWELGGATAGLTYFDGYRGWHAPPQWLRADGLQVTNPKLTPSLLHGTGFQFLHGDAGAVVHFHTAPGDRLRNQSRGNSLVFETTFDGPPTVERFVFVTSGDSRINLWTRAYEVVHAELRRALALPERTREVLCAWPPFGRMGFREMAAAYGARSAREGFTAACIDVVWDNIEFHGGHKNMNIWDYAVCDGYGGREGLQALVEECHKHGLRVIAWAPAGHLNGQAPIWRQHPDWVLRNPAGKLAFNPSGLYQGDLNTGFHDYFRDRLAGVVREFGLDGLWMDSHLAYAQQFQSPAHGAKLAAVYRRFLQAGARSLIVEGDASAFGSYGIAIGEDWEKAWGKIPDPELYYGATLMAGSMSPQFYVAHARRYFAAGAPWVISWEFLGSSKLSGPHVEAARRTIRAVIDDYRRVKDLMVHRFVHHDGSGYTWTNDRDATKVVWLMRDAALPDGRQGQGGRVYVVRPRP